MTLSYGLMSRYRSRPLTLRLGEFYSGSVVSIEVSSEVCPHKAENSRPSPFFSCGKMNLVILGVNSTRTGLIPKDWYINNTTTLWSFFFLAFSFWIGGGCQNLAHSWEIIKLLVVVGFVPPF
jgi:hypothetical protein